MKFLDTFLRHKKKNIYELEEHYKNLSSLQKRLGCIGSPDQRKKNPYDPVAYPSLFFRRIGEVDNRTNLEDYAKKLNDKYRVNKAIHDFNKAIIENDYFSNVRHIVKGGEFNPNSSNVRSRKTLSTSEYRPYSANPNGMRRNNSNENIAYVQSKAESLPVDNQRIESKTSPKKKRPKTGKPSAHYSGRISGSDYASHDESYGNSSKKKRRKSKSNKQRNSSIAKSRTTKSGKKKKRSAKKSGLKVTEQVQQEVIDTDNNEYTSNEGAQQVTEEVAEDM